MRRLAQILLSSLFLVVFGGVCLATDVPKLTGVFNDATSIISAAKRDEITAFLKEQEARTSNQIVVLVVPTIGGKDVDISQYGADVFNTWRLGHEGKDNGVLVTFARREGLMRITVGNGLQGTLPDLIANQILKREAQPFLDETKFGSAILATVKAIDRVVGHEYQAEPKLVPAPKLIGEKEVVNSEDSNAFGFFILFIFVVGVGAVIYFMIRSKPTSTTEEEDEVLHARRTDTGGYSPNHHRRSYDRPTPARRHNDDDGFLPGVVVGAALSRSHDRDDDSGSRGYSNPSRDPDPSPPSSNDSYSGGGGSTDSGGSSTSFSGGDGSGAD